MTYLKHILASIVLFMSYGLLKACDACKLNQPKITQDLTHGAGPESSWDWVIVIVIALLTLFTLVYSIKYLVSPREKNVDHIKRLILEDNNG